MRLRLGAKIYQIILSDLEIASVPWRQGRVHPATKGALPMSLRGGESISTSDIGEQA